MKRFVFDPNVSPLMAEDLSDLPKALVLTCNYDVLRDEGLLYAQRLQEHGVDTTYKDYSGGTHTLLASLEKLSLAEQFVDDIVKFIKNNV